MRYPAFLPPNGTIGFVAPSFGCATEPYKSAFLNAQKKWKEEGCQFQIGPNCYVEQGIGISNTPEKCGEELQDFYCSKENDCLISCGGGELMCEVLDYVDFERLKQAAPKWYMGYSDNTNMTFLLATLCDVASVYGPCAAAFGMEPWHPALQDAMNLLTGKSLELQGYDKWEKESLKGEENPYAPYHVTEPSVIRKFPDKTLDFSGRLLGGCMD
ncbi:MAG: LD-carboxypeptidase, partial [Lachnospiraceae bacterium]|nr:LD-carboxypeptidase [Lachnospiraceae bacterium]